MPQPSSTHAVVAGAGMAGLLAARVLSDHFDRVTVIERDRLQGGSEPRKGVPQGRHVHLLLPRGRTILEDRFPGLTRTLLSAGALKINGGRDFAWHYAGGWRTRHDSELELVTASRPLFEAHVLERVRALPNVALRDGTRVEAPMVEANSLTGAWIVGEHGRESVTADLLVDATGRGSSMPRWLEQLGCEPPASDTIPTPLTYSTCLFPRPDPGPDWRALFVNAPACRRAGVCIAIEGGRWLVTLVSLFDEPSPRDHESFRAFIRSLPVRDLDDAISGLEPLTDVVQHRFPASLRRRYERMGDLPSGLVAIGDAVCSFNPVYGQGMTVAAIEAEALDAALRGGRPDGFVRDWYRRIAAIIDVAWQDRRLSLP